MTSTQWSTALDVADHAIVAVRRSRAAQLDAVHTVVESGRWHIHGFRSPHAWLTTTTSEAPGAVRTTLHLADRIQRMPIVKDRFADGVLAESALRLLADAWHADIADAFARDEELLAGWAMTLAHRDFKMVLQTWRLHADPDGAERTAEEQFESRSLHLSELLDSMGRLDGLLDPEGFRIVQEAIRALAQRADGDDRTAAQRRADALVAMAKQALAEFEPAVGAKRRRPKVVATIAYDDLVAATRGGILDTNSGRTSLTPQAVRRLACDAGIHRLIHRAREHDPRLRTPDPHRVRHPVRRARTTRPWLPDPRLPHPAGRLRRPPQHPLGRRRQHRPRRPRACLLVPPPLAAPAALEYPAPSAGRPLHPRRPGWQRPSAQAAPDRPCRPTDAAVRAISCRRAPAREQHPGQVGAGDDQHE